ncbi:MAG: glycosyltransferase family 4 protein [Acidimicrobiales bacterium]
MVTVGYESAALLGSRTGVGVAVAGMLESLVARQEPDIEVVGFGLTGTGWKDLEQQLPVGVRRAKGPMPAKPLFKAWSMGNFPSVERWTGRLDVVHGTNFVVPPAKAAQLVTIYDLTPWRFPDMCSGASHQYPRLVSRALARGALVHTATLYGAAEVQEYLGVPADRIRVLPFGVGPTGPTGGGPARPAREGRPYLLALGTIEPRKGFPALVRAFDKVASRHPDLELRIAGPPGWGDSGLESALQGGKNVERIHLMGWVPDTRPLLAGALAFVSCSVYEGFGFPALEAMAAGVPVVATAAGAVPEVVGDAALLVPVGDLEALAEALDEVVDSPALRAHLMEMGLARASRLTWAETGAGLAQLYRDLAAAA